MEKGLELIIQDADKERQIYVPDTNVLVGQPRAMFILAGDWDSVRATPQGRELVERLEKEKMLDTSPNDVVIYDLVEEEIDDIRHNPKKEDLHILAGMARENLYNIRKRGQNGIRKGVSVVELDNGAKVYFLKHDRIGYDLEKRLDKPDNRIVWSFGRLVEAHKNSNVKFTFISQDISCRSKIRDEVTDVFAGDERQRERTDGCEDEFRFENATDEPHQKYTGIVRVKGTEDDLELFNHGMISLDPPETRPKALHAAQIKANQFIELHVGEKKSSLVASQDGKTAGALYNYERFMAEVASNAKEKEAPAKREVIVPEGVKIEHVVALIDASELDKTTERYHRLRRMVKKGHKDPEKTYREVQEELWSYEKPTRSSRLGFSYNHSLVPVDEQIYALEALMNPEVHGVSIIGPQGSGKTLWAVWAGLMQVDQRKYGKIVYYRSPRGMNKGHGFLPGSERDKMEPWTKPCEDAILRVFGYKDPDDDGAKAWLRKLEHQLHVIQYGVDTQQQGRTWEPNFIIVDEAQNYMRDEIKLLCGRPGEGTKLVLLGDPRQIGATHEVTHWFLNNKNSGLAHVNVKYPGKPRYAHVTLSKGAVRRSELASYAEDL